MKTRQPDASRRAVSTPEAPKSTAFPSQNRVEGGSSSLPPRSCMYCGCTDAQPCVLPLEGFDAAGRPYTRADTELCHWIWLEPPVCSARSCVNKWLAGGAAAASDSWRVDAPSSPFFATPLDRIADVQQLLDAAAKGPAAGRILGAATYDAIVQQLRLAAEEIQELQLELQDFEPSGDLEPGTVDSLFREVLYRVNQRRERRYERDQLAAIARGRVAEQLDHEAKVADAADAPQADGVR